VAENAPAPAVKKRFGGRISDRTIGLIGTFVGVPFGIIGIAVGVYLAVVVTPTTMIAQIMILGSAALVAVTALIVMWLLTLEIISSERAVADVRVENTDLRNEKAALDAQLKTTAAERDMQTSLVQDERSKAKLGQREVAALFGELARLIGFFESTVEDYRARVSRAKTEMEHKALRDDWEAISRQWDTILTTICETARSCILKYKSKLPETCTSNIKIVETLPGGEEVYTVMGYSGGRSPARNTEDAQGHRLVEKNAMYKDAFNKSDGILLVPDVNTYIKIASLATETFSYPTEGHGKEYQSCLIALIFETDPGHLRARSGPEAKPRLVGIFCVDSKELDYFNEEYEKLVMRQLAYHLLSCTRLYWAAGAAKARLPNG